MKIVAWACVCAAVSAAIFSLWTEPDCTLLSVRLDGRTSAGDIVLRLENHGAVSQHVSVEAASHAVRLTVSGASLRIEPGRGTLVGVLRWEFFERMQRRDPLLRVKFEDVRGASPALILGMP